MLNNCTFIGRLVGDPEIKTVKEAKHAGFTLAVDKRFKSKKEGAPTADFIPVSVWRNTADFVEKYFHKGKQVSVVGSLETYSYDKDGEKRYGFRINASEVGFADSAKAEDKPSGKGASPADDGFPVDEDADFSGFGDPGAFGDDLPF